MWSISTHLVSRVTSNSETLTRERSVNQSGANGGRGTTGKTRENEAVVMILRGL